MLKNADFWLLYRTMKLPSCDGLMCTAGWPLAAYVLIGRDDIAATAEASAAVPAELPQSSVPLASPVSSLALATPLHHGAGGGSSPKRPSLGRTPIRQPHLGTLPGNG